MELSPATAKRRIKEAREQLQILLANSSHLEIADAYRSRLTEKSSDRPRRVRVCSGPMAPPVSPGELEDLLGPRLFAAKTGFGAPVLLENRYELEHLRGRGARGLVVRARDVRLDRPVALKLYPSFEPALIDEVQREARILARLEHPNIVAVHDMGCAELDLGQRRAPMPLLGDELHRWTAYPVVGRDKSPIGGGDRGRVPSGGRGPRGRPRARDPPPRREAGEHRESTGRPRAWSTSGSRGSCHGQAKRRRARPSMGSRTGPLAYMAPEARRGHANARSDVFAFSVGALGEPDGGLALRPGGGHVVARQPSGLRRRRRPSREGSARCCAAA
jgi:hypothetical protein